MITLTFDSSSPDVLRQGEQLKASQKRLAPFIHQTALENIASGGLKPHPRGIEAVFGPQRQSGLIDYPPQSSDLRPALPMRQGLHVPDPKDEQDTRLIKIGLLLPDMDGQESELLALYLNKQARNNSICFVILSPLLRWLPLLGYMGIGFCAIPTDAPPEEHYPRAAERYNLSSIVDMCTGKIIWDRTEQKAATKTAS